MDQLRKSQIKEFLLILQTLETDLNLIFEDEEEYRENMPENLHDSEKYTQSEVASEYLQSALDELNESILSLEGVLN